jgi:hypothetical protein
MLLNPLPKSYDSRMSKNEIIAELPHLKAEDRKQVFQRLCELQNDDLRQGVGPTDQEKLILDQALADFKRDGNYGTLWRDR